jgi:hypothetical protein
MKRIGARGRRSHSSSPRPAERNPRTALKLTQRGLKGTATAKNGMAKGLSPSPITTLASKAVIIDMIRVRLGMSLSRIEAKEEVSGILSLLSIDDPPFLRKR